MVVARSARFGVAALLVQLDGTVEVPRGIVHPTRRGGSHAGALTDDRFLGRVEGDPEGVLEVAQRLLAGAQAGGPLGGAVEGEAGLDAERSPLVALGALLVGGQVVGGEHAGQLLVAERLEVARRGEVPLAALAAGERAVGDLAHQALGEAVLPPLG